MHKLLYKIGLIIGLSFFLIYMLSFEEQEILIEETVQSVPTMPDITSKDSTTSEEKEIVYDEVLEVSQIDIPIFTVSELSEDVITKITGISYQPNDQIPIASLRYLQISHYGFDGQIHVGEMIVNHVIADEVISIFEELYEHQYPIEKMKLVDEYLADDNQSMADNNTSAFNYRMIAGTNRLSNHSLGLAIDINPLYNPYVINRNGAKTILPIEGSPHVDRSQSHFAYIQEGDLCYNAFVSRGWTWGGHFKNSKDYQHFEKKLD